MGEINKKKCIGCIGYGHCKLHLSVLNMEGYIPKIIEDGAASICPYYAPKFDWEKLYNEFKKKQ